MTTATIPSTETSVSNLTPEIGAPPAACGVNGWAEMSVTAVGWVGRAKVTARAEAVPPPSKRTVTFIGAGSAA